MTLEWVTTHWVAVVLLIAYTTILLRNAYIGSRVSRGLDGFYVGQRSMGGVAIGISFFATLASTNSYIGHAGKGYEYGVAWMLLGAMLVLFTWVSWRWVGPKLRLFAHQWDALTLPDYLGSRFVEGEVAKHPLAIAAATVIAYASTIFQQ